MQHLASCLLGAEEALGECGDKADLDEEADDSLARRQDGYRVAEALDRLEEAASVGR